MYIKTTRVIGNGIKEKTNKQSSKNKKQKQKQKRRYQI